MVTIRLFAGLRDLAGTQELQFDLRQPSSVADLFLRLTAEFPSMEVYRNSLMIAVNEEYGSWDSPVEAGDEVAFFPPVSGGVR